MTAPTQSCTSCETPIPYGAMFCPACGEATPIGMSGETGVAHTPTSSNANEAEYRQRLQRALGDGHELREMIGQGGFGTVYAVWDLKLEREVAIKALRHDLFPSPDLLERFQREAKAVAKLRHPNILAVYAVGEGEGIAFMVMPKVEGESLRAALDRERQLSVDEVLRIATEVSGALQVAHDAGIVHRDVKPENILLEGKERRALLMDFGIAKATEGTSTAITGTGMLVGTPLYMSPEQASGERDIDHRSDIYALGCVTYEMLAGDPPFTGTNTQAIIARHIAETPPSLRIVRAGLSDATYNTVECALAKVPADRFSAASQFRDALQNAIQGGAPSPGGSIEPTPSAADASRSEPLLVSQVDLADVRRFDPKVDAVFGAAEALPTYEARARRSLGKWKYLVPAAAAILVAIVIGGSSLWMTMAPSASNPEGAPVGSDVAAVALAPPTIAGGCSAFDIGDECRDQPPRLVEPGSGYGIIDLDPAPFTEIVRNVLSDAALSTIHNVVIRGPTVGVDNRWPMFRIEGWLSDANDFWDFMRELSRSSWCADVVPGQVESIVLDDGTEGVAFNLSMLVGEPREIVPRTLERWVVEQPAQVAVLVAEDGSIAQVELSVSSGSGHFDVAAIRFATEAAEYRPALNDGRPVNAWIALNLLPRKPLTPGHVDSAVVKDSAKNRAAERTP